MLIWENVRLALGSLRENKMRSLLTMLGIIIGIGSVIAIMTVSSSLTTSITDTFAEMGANKYYRWSETAVRGIGNTKKWNEVWDIKPLYLIGRRRPAYG